jgi:probable F420-dependent oxidoreductase
MAIKIGIMFSNGAHSAEPEHATLLARASEALGFESLWAVQHVAIPVASQSRYPYSSAGAIPGGAFVAIPDPLVWLSFVAAATSSIRLATGILVLPQQPALVVAKQAATLDRLSGGRLMLGVGAGWLKEEFEALGVPFEGRGKLLDEQIEVLRAAWSEGSASYHGERIDFDEIAVEPKPLQTSIPIVIGGHTPAAVSRAVRLGDEFFPLAKRGEQLQQIVQELRQSAEQADRDPASIAITADAPRTNKDADAILALGVDRVVINAPNVSIDHLEHELERSHEEVGQLLH